MVGCLKKSNMDKVKFDPKTDTPCTRLKCKGVFVGSRMCLACSYCYDVNREENYISCLKKVKNFVQR